MNKNLHFITLFAALCFLTGLEIFLMDPDKSERLWLVIYINSVIIGLLFLYFLINRRHTEFKITMFLTVFGLGGGLVGIMMVVYFLLHIAWLGDAIRDYGIQYESSVYIWEHITFFFVFVFGYSAIVKYQRNSTFNIAHKKVVISGVSLLDAFERKQNVNLTRKEIDSLSMVRTYPNDYSKWDKNQWIPLIKTIEALPNIEEVVLLSTQDVQLFNTVISLDPFFSEFNIDKLLQAQFPKLKITWWNLRDPNVIGSITADVTNYLTPYLKTYEEKEIVFGLTSGTAPTTAALAMLSVKGELSGGYLRRDTDKIMFETIDVFTLRELWDELINIISKEK